jgi:hypothetical protein
VVVVFADAFVVLAFEVLSFASVFLVSSFLTSGSGAGTNTSPSFGAFHEI